jgi:hypothetical protein
MPSRGYTTPERRNRIVVTRAKERDLALVSLAQFPDDNPILTRRRDCKLFRSFRDCFLLVGSLNHPEMFEAMPDDIDAPARA